jgi:hypothetical protein
MSPVPPAAVWMRIFSPDLTWALSKTWWMVMNTTGNAQASSCDTFRGLWTAILSSVLTTVLWPPIRMPVIAITSSPSRTRVTPRPVFRTTPDTSKPGVNGYSGMVG